MRTIALSVVILAAGLVSVASSQPATPQIQNKRYFPMPLEKDPTREVGLQSVTMPPGGGNEFHRHPGDQWTAIQEGEITFTVKGKPPQVLKMRIFDKGKPASEPVPN
jgi:quercetin dioxygenase-like cupin family protein